MRTLAVAATLLALCLVLVALSYAASARGLGVTQYRPIPSSEFAPLPTASGRSTETVETPGAPGQSAQTAQPRNAPTPPRSRPPRSILPTHSITGVATWWNSWGHGLYAAAGPTLRAAMGPGYLHRYVTACARGQCVRVRLTTSCACSPDSRVIDLSLDAFSRLADPSLGIVEVVVSWN